MDTKAVLTIARQELTISSRSRWILGFAAVFGVLSLAISYFGTVTAGAAGLQGFERTAASLLSLILYLVPLLGLMLGTLNISRDRAANELLFAQPVTRSEILFGRLLGLLAAMSGAMFAGFAVAAAVILTQVGPDGLLRFTGLVALSFVLAAVFLSIGAVCGLLSESRTRAFGVALCVWFFFVMFYDLGVIGLAFVLRERTANVLIFVSLFGNPVDLARVSSLLTLGDPSIFGAAGAALLKFLGGLTRSYAALSVALSLWVVTPVLVAIRILRRIDL
jgi:Cu-processing system permease protein